MARLKNEIDFILCSNPGIVQDVEVLGKVRCSDHWMVRSRISVDLEGAEETGTEEAYQ